MDVRRVSAPERPVLPKRWHVPVRCYFRGVSASRWLAAAFFFGPIVACGTRSAPSVAPEVLPEASATASASSAPITRAMTDDDVAGAIREVAPNERTIPEVGRGAVVFTLDKVTDEAFAEADRDPSKAIRFESIRTDGIADKLGLRNGDVLHSIDDLRVGYTYPYADASANSAKTTWQRAWRGKGFTLKVRRAGQIIELTYRFVGG
jgi:hypothetical protein